MPLSALLQYHVSKSQLTRNPRQPFGVHLHCHNNGETLPRYSSIYSNLRIGCVHGSLLARLLTEH